MPKSQIIKCNGLGANVNIISFIPNCKFTLNGCTKYIHVGVLEKGNFDILAGNDFLNKFAVIINTKNRTYNYEHPIFGRVELTFVGEKLVKGIDFNKARLY